MSSFSNSFWSNDYAGGLGVLFGKLQQGVQENQQVLTICRMRADAEDLYGQKLDDITPATDRIAGGFSRDDGASVRKAYEGMRTEMGEAAKNHHKIASNIRELVVNPFGRWCEAHAQRVQNSQDDLQARIKVHDRQAETVRKLRSQYYNKCRLVEDLEEEDKLAFQDPLSEAAQSPKVKPTVVAKIPTIKEPEPEDEEEPIDLGDQMYQPEQVKKLLTHMLETIKLGETKVPILGTYLNVSTGADITEYIQTYMGAANVAYAEKVGQDLVDNGLLRLVGNVGSTFANSSKLNYQWRPKVFQITGIPEKKDQMKRVASLGIDGTDSPVTAVGELLSGWNPLNNPYPNETPGERLRREARESDERYKASVRKLDGLRCNLEEAMIDHLKFMERCELDRLKAIKAVILDFSGAISNVIPSLQSTVDNMMLFQETVQPIGDLRYLLENYQTGPFVPRVQVYENYYNSVDDQTYGVDLEARARADRKRVPLIVTTILMYLDNHYPDLDGDEARRAIWLVDVPLAAIHHLRNAINDGKVISHEVLDKYEIPIVASALKLYLLELPDSLVSAHLYEIVKTIYSTTAADTSEETRVSVIQSTLGQLRLANIATLDAITTHLTRLIELTSADESYITALATNLAPCVLRPKQETTLTMNERYNYRLLRDLFKHKDAIFGELKRASSQASRAQADPTRATPAAARPRGLSTDERGRQAAEQQKWQAITGHRSRASSPNPGANRMRRERSPNRMSGSAETRFPVSPSLHGHTNSGSLGSTGSGTPISSPTERRSTLTGNRGSLEVPGSAETSPVVETTSRPPNGSSIIAASENSYDATPALADGVEKRNSLGRSGRVPLRKPAAGGPGSLARQSIHGRSAMGGSAGVELSDRPMDD
ncbi:RhoGAP and Fes/CIP4 domain-containing protein [Trichodelitschia bisporula]|uniref:RhoGAP and Fes/CIP4 domain-containing protein n=1 Tax=Trichodelitschia bisporula TaxID=703511 RepID=A0A6G1IBE3_9PEZI|nr:RhoGAP and Fes/CIP4 domain-containing protein [Trichodelitschia bisporula]